jgi:formate-dependent nitrite reductase membrane component NrfD
MWAENLPNAVPLKPQNPFMERFALEAKTQRVWRVRHATWFTLMGVGGSVFLLARFLGLLEELGTFLGMPVVELVSFVAIAIGGIILISYMTRPLRMLNSFSNWRKSWISIGAFADVIFVIAGGLIILPDLELGSSTPFSGLPWDSHATSGTGRVLVIVAGIAAAFVIFYAGVVLAAPRAIPYWHSPAVPLQFLFSSLAMGMAVLMALAVFNDEPVEGGWFGLTALFTALLLASIVWHLSTNRDKPGKSHSLERLLRGQYRVRFLYATVLGGTVVPLVLSLIGAGAEGARDTLAVMVAVILLAGGFGVRLYTVRVGIFPPVKFVPSNGQLRPVRG